MFEVMGPCKVQAVKQSKCLMVFVWWACGLSEKPSGFMVLIGVAESGFG